MDYENFDWEDFLLDDFFITWIREPQAQHIAFWSEWLSTHPEKKEMVSKARLLVSSYNIKDGLERLNDDEIEEIIRQLNKKIAALGTAEETSIKQLPIRRQWIAVAAALLPVFLLGAWLYLKGFRHTTNSGNGGNIALEKLISYKNISPRSKFLRLPDGSVVILKGRSAISFPQTFKSTTRQVLLKGEAFFEVHKDPTRPFFIHSGNMVTRVVGTSFTIKAFAGDSKYQVIVNTGKVLVYTDDTKVGDHATAVTLVPHQQAILYTDHSKLIKDTVTTQLVLATDNAAKEFTFNNTPVSNILKKLEAAYGVQIDYNEKELEHQSFTGVLSNLPLDQKISLICKAINARCDFGDGRIRIENITIN